MTDAEVAIAKLNNFIKVSKEAKVFDPGKISDGYHTFDELYDHRMTLFCVLLNTLNLLDSNVVSGEDKFTPWKSKLHSDGTMFEGGWFVAGIGKEKGEQITYHLPLKYWDRIEADELKNAPEYDGHTPHDTLERLAKLL